MAMTVCRTALVFLVSLLACCFSADAALTKRNHATELRGTMKKSHSRSSDDTAEDEDDDDEDDDDDDDKKDDDKKDDDKKDDDKKDDKKDDTKDAKKDGKKENVGVTQVDAKESKKDKEVDALKVELKDNKEEQDELNKRIKHLSDEAKSDQEIDSSAALVGNETQSPAMANMMGKMWKEMRMFNTPFYGEHVEEQVHHLKMTQHKLEAKIAAKEGHKTSAEIKDGAVQKAVIDDSSGEGAAPGHEDCRCIGINELEGETIATLKDGSKVAYPADLGGQCSAWDLDRHPSCPGASWCKQKWCYVDPCKCKNVGVAPKVSVYLKDAQYQGKPVHFSYATCGGKDSYSSESEKKKSEKAIAQTCAVEVDSKKWGAENCRCIGVSPQPGTTKVMIKGKHVDFPADTGAVCNAWEKDNHPECDSDDAPDWCGQSWCYVDPCSCTLPTPPKTTSYLPESTYLEKPIYYSYATCGGKDSWTAGNKKACVNQKTPAACAKNDKCAWTGKECLGKELVNVCGLEEKSGSWSSKALIALVLPVLALFH